jgi:hypothetical protein
MHASTNGRPVQGPDSGAALQTAAGLLVHIEPLLVNRPEAARLLSISPRKLDEWVAQGLIPKWQRDGVVRFSVEDLRAFVTSNSPKRTAGDGRRPRTPSPSLRNGVDVPSI